MQLSREGGGGGGGIFGVLYLIRRSKKDIFGYIREGARKKTKGWKEKLLS